MKGEEIMLIDPSIELKFREFNLVTYPFFVIWDKDKRKSIEIKTSENIEHKKVEKILRISWDQEIGPPGPATKEVFVALEQHIRSLGYPVKEYVPFTLYDITKRLGKKKGGHTNELIRKALDVLLSIKFYADGFIYDKRKGTYLGGERGGIFDNIWYSGDILPDGERANTNVVKLNVWYQSNVNARLDVCFDYEYYMELLKRPISARLFELLSVDFIKSKNEDKSTIIRYSNLCDYLPTKRQRYLSDARKILDPSHISLKESGFIEDVTWEDAYIIDAEDEHKDWFITYWPGKRAKRVVEDNGHLRLDIPRKYTLASETRALESGDPSSALSPSQKESYELLLKNGITASVAMELSLNFSKEQIEDRCRAVPYVPNLKSKAGYIVKAIKEDYALPLEYVSNKKRDERKQTKERKKETSTLDVGIGNNFELCQEEKDEFRKELKYFDMFESLPRDEKIVILTQAINAASFISPDKKDMLKKDSAILIDTDQRNSIIDIPDWIKIRMEIANIIGYDSSDNQKDTLCE